MFFSEDSVYIVELWHENNVKAMSMTQVNSNHSPIYHLRDRRNWFTHIGTR